MTRCASPAREWEPIAEIRRRLSAGGSALAEALGRRGSPGRDGAADSIRFDAIGVGRRRPVRATSRSGRPEARRREPRRPPDARVRERPRRARAPRIGANARRPTATAAWSTCSPSSWQRHRSGSRSGLLQDYVTREETLHAYARTAAAVRAGRSPLRAGPTLECRFDELETDIVENQLLAGALGDREARRVDPDATRCGSRARRSSARSPTRCACSAETPELEYNRRNEHYRSGARNRSAVPAKPGGQRPLFARGRATRSRSCST